jgi:hypothetical protein
MNGRNNNMEKFKPGVEGMVLLFSDNNGEVVYQFPYYDYFKAELEPLLHEVRYCEVMMLQSICVSGATTLMSTEQCAQAQLLLNDMLCSDLRPLKLS